MIVIWQSADVATRDIAEQLRDRVTYPLRIVHSAAIGIVPAENAGLDAATGEIILLIDDDAVAPAGWIARHLGFYSDSSVGAVGGPANNFRSDGTPFPKRTVEPVGKLTWFGKSLGNMYDHADEWRRRPAKDVDHLVGYNFSIRRKAFQTFEVGLKPYWQMFEMDACLQAKARGYRILFDFGNVVDHHPTNTVYAGGRDGDLETKVWNSAFNHAFLLAKHSRYPLKHIRLLYLLGIGTVGSPGLLGFLFSLRRFGHFSREKGILRKTWQSHWRGWMAGNRRREDRARNPTSLKILFLSPTGKLGGAEASLLHIMAGIREIEPSWTLCLAAADDGPLLDRVRSLGVETMLVPFPPAVACCGDAGAGGPAGKQIGRIALMRSLLAAGVSSRAYVKRLRRVIQATRPDVVHASGFKMHLFGVWSQPRRTPLIWHIHDYVGPRPIMRRLLRRYAKRPALALASSKSLMDEANSFCDGQVKIRAVGYGIDLDCFSPLGDKADLDALSGLPPASAETVRVGLIATLARWKGHAVFLRALSLLPAGLPIRAYIVGDALYKTKGSQFRLDELRQMAVQMGVSHMVGFTGFLDEQASAMRALDVVVHASTEPEPFGLVIVEGMACGRAVIASHSGGATEIVEPGKNALSHPPGDASALAERIRELAMNPGLRAELGKAGRVSAVKYFGRARMATDLIAIYKQCTATFESSPHI